MMMGEKKGKNEEEDSFREKSNNPNLKGGEKGHPKPKVDELALGREYWGILGALVVANSGREFDGLGIGGAKRRNKQKVVGSLRGTGGSCRRQ